MKASLKNKAFFQLLIIIAVFPLILSIPFNIRIDTKYNVETKGKKYLGYIVSGGGPRINYIVSAYSGENRIGLSQSYQGEAKLYLKVEGYDSIDFEIQCSDYPCSGERDNNFFDSIPLLDGEPINFFVNKDMSIDFEFKLEYDLTNVWVRGQYELSAKLNDETDVKKKNIGNTLTAYIIEKNSKASVLTVNAKKGDYINVGLIGYNKLDDCYSQALPIEGPIITGFLHKDVLKKVCYDLNEEQMGEESIVGSGVAITKFITTSMESSSAPSPGGGRASPVEQSTSNGLIKNIIIKPYTRICLSLPDLSEFDGVEDAVFTYQTAILEDKKKYVQKEPQLNGIFYPGILSVGSRVAFISHKNGEFEKMTLNLNSLRGFPKMYVYECDNYPLCFYNNKLKNEIIPKNINRFSSYNVLKKEGYDDSPISEKQTLFVVECTHAQPEYNDTYWDSICDFNTLTNKEHTTIQLLEEKYFNQYALNNDEHNYKIKLGKQKGIQKVFIDIMTYVGEVEINTQQIKDLGIEVSQNEAINKKFITAKTNGKAYDELNFSVMALSNTYYTILVTLAKNENDEDSFMTNVLETGMSYLVTVDEKDKASDGESNKIINYKNDRMADKIPFLVNFYSLNCEIVVKTGDKEIDTFEYFSHDLIKPEEPKYYSSQYEYKISVKTPDPSDYNGKLCKIYSSAIETNVRHDDYTRDILIPDNTQQQIKLGPQINHISFGYVHVDFQNDLLIKFDLIETAKYKVQIYYENHPRDDKDITIVADNLLYLKSSEWSNICKDVTRVCYIQLDITLEETKDEGDRPLLELSIKSMGSNFVNYIPKNQFKQDYAQNNIPQYYYTEIGRKEEGFITTNFMRGSGIVTARIIKDLDKVEDNEGWRGKYKYPTENELTMDPFTEKLSFNTNDEDCANGCYLLISVVSDVISTTIELDQGRNYPYSIMIQSYYKNNGDSNIPTIRIPVDEYIVGSIDPSSSDTISQYYSVWLSSDADYVAIDWQSNGGSFYINVGEEKPTTSKSDFQYPSVGKDTLYKIPKAEILTKNPTPIVAGEGLKDIVLTIGVWTDVSDSIYTTPFSFAVRLIDEGVNEIYRVNSDQKVLCKPSKISGEKNFRCVYVMDYDYIHDYTGIYVYANLQDKSASSSMYANFIDAVDYEMSQKNIESFIPKKGNCKYSTDDKQLDYLRISEGTKINTYVLVSVEVNKETTIELISTIFLLQDEITPNPSSYQLMTAYPSFDTILNFPKEYMEMVHITCLGGSGIINWEDNTNKQYYLKGRDDRISITSSKSKNEHKMRIQAVKEDENKIEAFVFIVEYNIRNDNSNFDSLDLEKSVNYIYTDSDLPIVLYCPINTFNMVENDYYDIFFTFYDLETSEDKPLTYYESYSFIVQGFIVQESELYDLKSNPEKTPEKDENTIFGYYDAGVRSGLLRIKEKRLNKTSKQYFLLKLEKSEPFKDVRKYSSLSLETGVYQKSAGIPVSELTNQYGYLNVDQNEVEYILRNDKTKTYLNLEFSCEDENINVFIKGDEPLTPKTQEFGKKFYFFVTKNLDEFITLKLKRNGNDESSLEFFFFRYTFSEKEINSKYTISNTTLNVTQSKKKTNSDYSITLVPVEDYDKYDVTYIIRLMTDVNMPKNSDISMKMGTQNVKEFYNPKSEGDLLNLNIYDASSDVQYIQVIAQIKEKENVEFLSYDLQNSFTKIDDQSETNPSDGSNDEKGDHDGDGDGGLSTTALALIIVGCALVVIIIIVIIVVCLVNHKKKDLVNKVNQISFADENRPEGDDLLGDSD